MENHRTNHAQVDQKSMKNLKKAPPECSFHTSGPKMASKMGNGRKKLALSMVLEVRLEAQIHKKYIQKSNVFSNRLSITL